MKNLLYKESKGLAIIGGRILLLVLNHEQRWRRRTSEGQMAGGLRAVRQGQRSG